jgi:hypothetical protein
MAEDSIDVVISHIGMGYLVTLQTHREDPPMDSSATLLVSTMRSPHDQGLTLVHFSARQKHSSTFLL